MKILITGANGFIGRNLAAALNEYEVTKLTRQTVDLTDRDAVDNFFKGKSFDVVAGGVFPPATVKSER